MMFQNYTAYCNWHGNLTTLIQYKDYAHWHNLQLQEKIQTSTGNIGNEVSAHQFSESMPLDFPRAKAASSIAAM